MKHNILLPAVVAAAMLSACVNHNPPKRTVTAKDTLTYTYHTVKERDADCGASPDSACTVALYSYPVFKSSAALNDSLKSVLVGFFNSDQEPVANLDQSAKLFLTAYDNYKRMYPKTVVPFKLKSYSRVLRQDSSLTVVEADIYVYMGSGNGGTITRFINWDTGSGKKLVLRDLLEDNYPDHLNKIAESIFRKNEHLADSEPLAGYLFPGHQFALNDNFQVTPEGLLFLYNQNEIKPHEAGATALLVPYEAIRPLLRPNSVLYQFIKQ
jgi:hypothetical protein